MLGCPGTPAADLVRPPRIGPIGLQRNSENSFASYDAAKASDAAQTAAATSDLRTMTSQDNPHTRATVSQPREPLQVWRRDSPHTRDGLPAWRAPEGVGLRDTPFRPKQNRGDVPDTRRILRL